MTLTTTLTLTAAPTVLQTGWRPARMFGAGHAGAWFCPRTGAYTDLAGTQRATVAGQAIALLRDLSGNGGHAAQPVAAQRPTLGRHPAGGIRNMLPNTAQDGAVVGVLGAGGAMPTGWSVVGIAQGAVSVLGFGMDRGLPYLDLRMNGTPTGTMEVVFAQPFVVTAQPGQNWTGSAYVQRLAGSNAGLTQAWLRTFSATATGQNVAGGTTEGTNLISVWQDEQHAATTRLSLPATSAWIRSIFRLGISGESIDVTLRIRGVQLEQGTSATAAQIVRTSGYDVTEAGQRDCWYVQPDGVDDWMQLDTAFVPAGAYTLFAAWESFGGGWNQNTIFGVQSGLQAFLARGTGIDAGALTGVQLRAFNFENRADVTGITVPTPRAVDVLQVSGPTTVAFRRNGLPFAGAVSGTVIPMHATGLNALFRRGGEGVARGRFYGGALVAAALPAATLDRMTRTLARAGGFSL